MCSGDGGTTPSRRFNGALNVPWQRGDDRYGRRLRGHFSFSDNPPLLPGWPWIVSFHFFVALVLCSAQLSSLCALLFSFVWPSFSVMPREWGKPKRGPSWYCYAARQRCLCELAWASSTALIQRNKEPKMPPMAYVEEEILEEPIMVPPDSLLYMVPDPHDRPNTSLTTMDTVAALEGATCIVQEEIPWTDRPTEPPLPTSDMDRDSSSPWTFWHREHLELIFEMRRDMMEQLHRHTLLSSRIDMLFDAFSSASQAEMPNLCNLLSSLLTATLWMAGSIVLTVHLMFKVYQLSTLHLQGTGVFFALLLSFPVLLLSFSVQFVWSVFLCMSR
jgi:hypothetical protein